MSNKALIFWVTVTSGVVAVIALLYLLEGEVPSPTRVWKLGAIGAALKYLLSFVGVFVTYLLAKSFVLVSSTPQNWLSELKLYLICIGACALLALCLATDLGTHRENDDPVFGGGEIVVDYVPTKEQRSRHGLIVFLCLIIPAVYGIHGGIKEAREKR